jgi:hypothetical protein
MIRYRWQIATLVSLLVAITAVTYVAAGAGAAPERAQTPVAATVSDAGWRFEMTFRFAGPIGDHEAGQVVRVGLGDGTVGVFAGTAGTTLVVAGETYLSLDHATAIDRGAAHRLRLDLKPAPAGTAYELSIDGRVIHTGVAKGLAYSRPSIALVSPFGDLAEASEITVSGIGGGRLITV